MIRLVKEGVVREVETQEQADRYLARGYEAIPAAEGREKKAAKKPEG